jgi:DNA adenine methylase
MTYPGGKNGSGVYQKLINLMPPHDVYIEPFLGSGAVLRYKRPAITSIAADLDADVVDSFRLRYPSIPGLVLNTEDAMGLLRRLFSGPSVVYRRTLVYADPPYLFSTRASKDPLYRCEFGTAEQHCDLLQLLRSLPCMVMVSGYDSDLYRRELAGWRVISFQSMTRSGRLATEFVWMNFPAPAALHDYRFLGRNFRERERITRKVKRWTAKMENMPQLERLAILSALEALSGKVDK